MTVGESIGKKLINLLRGASASRRVTPQTKKSDLTPLDENPIWGYMKDEKAFELLYSHLSAPEQAEFYGLISRIVEINKAAKEGGLELHVKEVKEGISREKAQNLINSGIDSLINCRFYITAADNLDGASISFVPTYQHAKEYLASRIVGGEREWYGKNDHRLVDEGGSSFNGGTPEDNRIVQGWKPGLVKYKLSDVITIYSPYSHVVGQDIVVPCKNKEEAIQGMKKLLRDIANNFVPSHQSPLFFKAEALLLKAYDSFVKDKLSSDYDSRIEGLRELVSRNLNR